MTTIGRTIDNRYTIREEIGSGGFGAVYLAEDTRFTGNNRVAIKKISQSNELTAKAFRHEANLLYNLSHPNLPKVTNCFQEADANFIVMDYIAGEDLMKQLKKGKRFAVAEVLEIADKVLDALEYLHSFLIFHRDIKPHNIKIDETGKIFLLDFGTAKGQFDDVTLSLTDQSITGYTPFYAPLEQVLRVDANSYLLLQSIESPNLEKFEQNKTDARSDVYSLGATIYHLLTAFSPERATATIRAHLIWSGKNDPLPDCRSYNEEISDSLAAIIKKCLAIDPEERFQTATQLRAALNSLPLTGNAPEKPSENFAAIGKTEFSPPLVSFNPAEKTPPVIVPANFKMDEPPKPIAAKSPWRWAAYIGLPVLLLSLAAFGGWFAWRGSADEVAEKTEVVAGQSTATLKNPRSFNYSLFVQKMRDRKEYQEPFESSGQEIFESGYKFQLRFTPPDSGFLYVFNEGLNEKGEKVFSIQFPTPSVNNKVADVQANRNYESGQLQFDGKPGTESFWIAWSKTPVDALEKARENAFQNSGAVADADLRTKLKDYLENGRKSRTDVSKDAGKKVTRIDFEGDAMVYMAQLEHR